MNVDVERQAEEENISLRLRITALEEELSTHSLILATILRERFGGE